jgi:hypothetical protein
LTASNQGAPNDPDLNALSVLVFNIKSENGYKVRKNIRYFKIQICRVRVCSLNALLRFSIAVIVVEILLLKGSSSSREQSVAALALNRVFFRILLDTLCNSAIIIRDKRDSIEER